MSIMAALWGIPIKKIGNGLVQVYNSFESGHN